jgi:hypothetical protein
MARLVARCPLLVGWLVALAGCSSQTVRLGQREPKDAGVVVDAPSIDTSIEPTIDAPAVDAPPVDATADGWAVPEFEVPGLVDLSGGTASDPTLTKDLQEIYFLSNRSPSDHWDVWFASRPPTSDSFGIPERISAVSTLDDDKSPAISDDGQTLWVGRLTTADAGLGGYDIYQSTRSGTVWQTPTLVADLSSSEDDTPRPLGNSNQTMPLTSRRAVDASTHLLTFLATRAGSAATFANADIREATELEATGYNAADAFLTDNGLDIYFTRAATGSGDIFVAHRATADGTFGKPQALSSSINTLDFDERDPFLAADGTLFFASDRDGSLKIYQARPK